MTTRPDSPAGDRHRAETSGEPLRPVIEALLAAARRDAAQVIAAAQAEAAQAMAQAQARADTLATAARAAGLADAATVAAGRRARGRRTARSIVLSARREAFEELVSRTHAAVRTNLDAPEVLQILEAMARRALGPDAVVTSDAPGAVTATAGTRRVRLSLDDFTDKAIADVGLSP